MRQGVGRGVRHSDNDPTARAAGDIRVQTREDAIDRDRDELR